MQSYSISSNKAVVFQKEICNDKYSSRHNTGSKHNINKNDLQKVLTGTFDPLQSESILSSDEKNHIPPDSDIKFPQSILYQQADDTVSSEHADNDNQHTQQVQVTNEVAEVTSQDSRTSPTTALEINGEIPVEQSVTDVKIPLLSKNSAQGYVTLASIDTPFNSFTSKTGNDEIKEGDFQCKQIVYPKDNVISSFSSDVHQPNCIDEEQFNAVNSDEPFKYSQASVQKNMDSPAPSLSVNSKDAHVSLMHGQEKLLEATDEYTDDYPDLGSSIAKRIQWNKSKQYVFLGDMDNVLESSATERRQDSVYADSLKEKNTQNNCNRVIQESEQSPLICCTSGSDVLRDELNVMSKSSTECATKTDAQSGYVLHSLPYMSVKQDAADPLHNAVDDCNKVAHPMSPTITIPLRNDIIGCEQAEVNNCVNVSNACNVPKYLLNTVLTSTDINDPNKSGMLNSENIMQYLDTILSNAKEISMPDSKLDTKQTQNNNNIKNTDLPSSHPKEGETNIEDPYVRVGVSCVSVTGNSALRNTQINENDTRQSQALLDQTQSKDTMEEMSIDSLPHNQPLNPWDSSVKFKWLPEASNSDQVEVPGLGFLTLVVDKE